MRDQSTNPSPSEQPSAVTESDPEWMDPRRTQYADMSDADMHAMYARMEIRSEIERHQAQRKTEQLARMALEPRSDFRVEHNELMAAMTRLLTQLAAVPIPPVVGAMEDDRAGVRLSRESAESYARVEGAIPSTRPTPPIEKPQRRVLPE